MTGTVRQLAHKALSLARVLDGLKVGYVTLLAAFACVAIGFVLGSMNTMEMAKDGIERFQDATNAAILRRYG